MDGIKPVSDKEFMDAAIVQAQKGLGWVHPNPPVGAIILDKNNSIVAQGWHKKFGGPHAEVEALSSLSDPSLLSGATMYVTLEPCAHEGKTPSCARALAKLPLKKVIYGLKDPNPLVSGKGAAIIKEAGIEAVEFSGSKEKVEELCEIFLWNMRQKKTFVAIKAATSRDGHLKHSNGQLWVTGEESRRHVHSLRAQYDAVLVGKNTFLDDNPSLNIRSEVYGTRENYAIVLDSMGSSLDLLKGSKLMSARSREKIIWVAAEGVASKVSNRWGVEMIEVPLSKNTQRLDLNILLEKIYLLGIKSLFVEGGAETYGSFIVEDLVNRIYHFKSSEIYGKQGIKRWLSIEAEQALTQRIVGKPQSLSLGRDLFISYKVPK